MPEQSSSCRISLFFSLGKNDCDDDISALFLYYALDGARRLSSPHRKPTLGLAHHQHLCGQWDGSVS